MNFKDKLVDQYTDDQKARMRAGARAAKLRREDVVEVVEGAPVVLGVATVVSVAGEDVVIMARSGMALMTAHQKITNFAEFSCGKAYKVGMIQVSDITIDDEL